jgi:hypothetical protein
LATQSKVSIEGSWPNQTSHNNPNRRWRGEKGKEVGDPTFDSLTKGEQGKRKKKGKEVGDPTFDSLTEGEQGKRKKKHNSAQYNLLKRPTKPN